MLARLYCRSSAALQGMLAPSACGRERPGLLQRRACAFCGTFCARVASCVFLARTTFTRSALDSIYSSTSNIVLRASNARLIGRERG
jgi:hypothetical protein